MYDERVILVHPITDCIGPHEMDRLEEGRPLRKG